MWGETARGSRAQNAALPRAPRMRDTIDHHSRYAAITGTPARPSARRTVRLAERQNPRRRCNPRSDRPRAALPGAPRRQPVRCIRLRQFTGSSPTQSRTDRLPADIRCRRDAQALAAPRQAPLEGQRHLRRRGTDRGIAPIAMSSAPTRECAITSTKPASHSASKHP